MHDDHGKGNPQFFYGKQQVYEVDILLKLLPYFDVPLNEKAKEMEEAKSLRKLLGLAKTEADMLARHKNITTLL